MSMVAGRLERLIPLLEDGRETHVIWRDWLRKDPGNIKTNPQCGDADFHDGMVTEYDERIAAVKAAVAEIQRLTALLT